MRVAIINWVRWNILRQRGFCSACGGRYSHWTGGLECYYACPVKQAPQGSDTKKGVTDA